MNWRERFGWKHKPSQTKSLQGEPLEDQKKMINTLLSTLSDETLGLTGEELALKPEFNVENNLLNVTLQAGFPTQSLEKTLLPSFIKTLHQKLPDCSINVNLDSFIQAHRTQLVGKGLRGVKNAIAVASGKGGVGKSTVTVKLATSLASLGAKVGILDADIYGPSIPLMLGPVKPVEAQGEHYLPALAHGIQAMSIGYLTDNNQALIWRGPMLAKSLLQMINITQWDELDYLLIDLPPGTGDIQLSLVQKIPLAGAVVVTTPQLVATLDAQKAIRMFEKTGISVLGIIENMSLHQCSQCGYQETLFGQGGGQELSDAFKLPLLGQLPLDMQIRRQCDEGKPIASNTSPQLTEIFIKTALKLAIALAQKPLNFNPINEI